MKAIISELESMNFNSFLNFIQRPTKTTENRLTGRTGVVELKNTKLDELFEKTVKSIICFSKFIFSNYSKFRLIF